MAHLQLFISHLGLPQTEGPLSRQKTVQLTNLSTEHFEHSVEKWGFAFNAELYFVGVSRPPPQASWFLFSDDSDRILCFKQLEKEGFQERIEFRAQPNGITGDIRQNTLKYRFDDWELLSMFRVTDGG